MGFNELNSVEHYIIHQLSGVNLNDTNAAEPKVGYGAQWEFKSSEELKRSVNEVLVESELKASLVRLNPEINSKNPYARFLQKSLINQLF
jgi:type I restriction enzyme R subunit